MEQIWHTVDFLFNTVIFMLAGVIIGAAAANTGAGGHGNTVEAADYGSLNMFHTHSTLPDMSVYSAGYVLSVLDHVQTLGSV